MTALAIIGTVVSGVIGAAGAVQSANAQADAAEYNAKVDERNRTIVMQQTSADQADKRRENRRNLASIRAAYGASGFEMAGSPLEVLEDTALDQETDVARVGYEGELRAMGLTESAARNRAEGANAKRAGKLNAASSLIGSATQAGQIFQSAGRSIGG